MILAVDTSTPICRVCFVSDTGRRSVEWEAGRQLADGLIGYLRRTLQQEGAQWSDIAGIIAYRGPGSFTGLRIGLTVVNTLADDVGIPIIGTTGNEWLEEGLERLEAGENDRLVLPLYGREPNITTSRK